MKALQDRLQCMRKDVAIEQQETASAEPMRVVSREAGKPKAASKGWTWCGLRGASNVVENQDDTKPADQSGVHV